MAVGSPPHENVSNLPSRVVHCLKSFQEGGVIMKLTIYFDGSFWCGLVEVEDNGHYQAIRHVFGPEPKDADVWEFVTKCLPHADKPFQQKQAKKREKHKGH